MKTLVFTRYAKSNNTMFTDPPRPALQSDDILVQVHAVGLNPVDNRFRKEHSNPS